MRKALIAAVALVALVVAGLAVAKTVGTRSATAVSAGFQATTASNVSTRTCTTTDGKTLEISRGTYTGQSTGAADLTGPVTVAVHSTVNTTDGYGVVDGRLEVDVASGHDAVAQFTGVYDHGNVAGLAAGRAQGPHVALLGNFSSAFTTAGGFTGGKLGTGSTGGAAVELGPARCAPAKPAVDRSAARGAVTAASASSITVAGLTCSVPTALSAKVTALTASDRAEIECRLVNGTNTLEKVHKLNR
jgi:hypothetical protein